MNGHWLIKLRVLSRNLSVTAGLYCIAAVAAALVAIFFAPYVPDGLADRLGSEAVGHILSIMASSMLVVVTFSLSTLVATYSIVAAVSTPRATSQIVEDSRSQKALSSFLGAFIFSIVSLVALSTKYYGPNGRVILFLITVVVLAAIIWTIIRWIGQLSSLSRLENVIAQIESTAEDSIKRQSIRFAWQVPAQEKSPKVGIAVDAKACGFIQSMDFDALSKLASTHSKEIYLQCTSGQFVYPNFVLAYVDPPSVDEKFADRLRSCFFLGDRRTLDDDPRFGFIVLSEIASRALSPSVNDPGTAIHILNSLVRLMLQARVSPKEANTEKWSPLLHIRRFTAAEVFDDAFRAIARDGAGIAEVSIFLQKALAALGEYPEFHEAAKFHAEESLKRSSKSLTSDFDIERVTEASRKLLKNKFKE